MSFIEGIGDEVTQFCIALLVVGIVAIGWWTTNIREPQSVRSGVYLLNYRLRFVRDYQRSYLVGTSSVQVEDLLNPAPDLTANETNPEIATTQAVVDSDSSESAEVNGEEGNEPAAPHTIQEIEQAAIVQAMDADTDLRQRRVAFFERSNDQHLTDRESNTDNDSGIMEHNYAEVPSSEPVTVPDDITIKLKYTNDEMKVVTGRLEELLGDFKKRHFAEELSNNKLVRLIFNGKILQREDATLGGCGIFDNCVVHCLVHQRRSTPSAPGSGGAGLQHSIGTTATTGSSGIHHHTYSDGGLGGLGPPQGMGDHINQREWDLGNIFAKCANFILIAAWYFRYSTPHVWTVTATLSLVALTVLSLLIYTYNPIETEHSRRQGARNATPSPMATTAPN